MGWLPTFPQTKKIVPQQYCIYYGPITQINGSAGSVTATVNVLSAFPLVILGPFTTYTGSAIAANDQSVIQQLVAKGIKVFLYLYLGVNNANPNQEVLLTDAQLTAKIDATAVLGCAGVFLDQYGYDWQTTRTQQNRAVSYTHSKGMNVIANGWFPAHGFGVNPDYYPQQCDSLVPVNWMGAYSSTQQYNVNDGVNYNSTDYRCYAQPPIGTLPTNTNYFGPMPTNAGNFKGPYDPTVTYSKYDVAHYQNNDYICNVYPTLNVLPTNTANWSAYTVNGVNVAAHNFQAGDYFMAENFAVVGEGYRPVSYSNSNGEADRMARLLYFCNLYGMTILPLAFPRQTGGSSNNRATVINYQSDADFAYKLASFYNLQYFAMTYYDIGGAGYNSITIYTPSTSAKSLDNASYVGPLSIVSNDGSAVGRSIGGTDYLYTSGSIVQDTR